ncbi:MAG: deoxycytidylate deaminase [Bacillota bacterium]
MSISYYTRNLPSEARAGPYRPRALHAEENAILNAPSFVRSPFDGKLGTPAQDERVITLYVTTYPCNLCANKIVRSSIRRIVYLEPYPMPEAKDILQHANVDQVPFEGVTFNGYFRFVREG